MKIITAIICSISIVTNAATFEYKTGLVIQAKDFRTAAKICYKKLNPVFVTEEKALDVIDVCTNPIHGEIK